MRCRRAHTAANQNAQPTRQQDCRRQPAQRASCPSPPRKSPDRAQERERSQTKAAAIATVACAPSGSDRCGQRSAPAKGGPIYAQLASASVTPTVMPRQAQHQSRTKAKEIAAHHRQKASGQRRHQYLRGKECNVNNRRQRPKADNPGAHIAGRIKHRADRLVQPPDQQPPLPPTATRGFHCHATDFPE
jgi:hypothetical protein